MSVVEILKPRLRVSEGWRSRPYRDTVGKLTIGYGHNLDAKGISLRAGEVILEDDILDAMDDLDRFLHWWRTLDPARQSVLAEMMFNMGPGGPGKGGLLSFVNTLPAIREGRWDEAARGMLASHWARQVKGRAVHLASIMRTGEEP